MGMTRGNIIDRVVSIIGNNSPAFRTYLETSLNNMMYALWDRHDWIFKQQSGTFNTVAGTESYNIGTSSTNIRSVQDIEVLYDTTNKRFLNPLELREIRKAYPGEDHTGQPTAFARWGTKTIYLAPKPNVVATLKYLFTSKPTVPTADANDLESFCGIPDYAQYVLEKMLLAEGFLFDDESRRAAMLDEINQIWMPNAIQADMKHLESSARFKFWEEEMQQNGLTFDSWLARVYSSNGGY